MLILECYFSDIFKNLAFGWFFGNWRATEIGAQAACHCPAKKHRQGLDYNCMKAL